QRRGGRAGRALGGGRAPGQAHVRRGPGLPLVLPEAEVFGPARGDRRPARPADDGRGRVRAAHAGPDRPSGHPDPGAHVTRPAIAVTIENPRQEPEVFRLREDYVRSVETAGGLPLIFAPGRPQDAGEVLDHVGGLLLTGGADVDPRQYGETPHPKLGPTFDDRDAFELALCREALRRDLPILAICRGHQVLNVATGGTLVQDIPSQIP